MSAPTAFQHFYKEGFASVIALLLHLHYGICEGFTGVLIQQLPDTESAMSVSDEQLSWIVSLFILSMPLGSLLSGAFMEICGRKTALQLAFLLSITGWAIIFSASSVLSIYVGRVITGIAVGMEPAIVVYIAEVNTPACRVLMMALTILMPALGTFVVYVLGFLLPWRQVAQVFTATSAVSFVALFCIPESPVWLIMRDQPAAALASLERLRNADDHETTQVEFAAMRMQLAKTASSADGERESYLRKIVATKAWKPFLMLELFFILQELSGNGLMAFYSTRIYRLLGTPIDELLSSIGYTTSTLLSSLLFLAVVNRIDRKTLGFWSAVGVCLSYSTIVAYTFLLDGGLLAAPLWWLPLAATWTGGACGTLGIHSLPWQMPAELLPGPVRGFMNGLLVTSVYCWMFVVVKLSPSVVAAVGIRGLLAMLAMAAGADALFARFVLLETRGKTLAEIEQFW